MYILILTTYYLLYWYRPLTTWDAHQSKYPSFHPGTLVFKRKITGSSGCLSNKHGISCGNGYESPRNMVALLYTCWLKYFMMFPQSISFFGCPTALNDQVMLTPPWFNQLWTLSWCLSKIWLFFSVPIFLPRQCNFEKSSIKFDAFKKYWYLQNHRIWFTLW